MLLSTGGPSTIGPLLTKRAAYRVEDFSQVITIGLIPLVVVAHPTFPPRTPRELIDYAKANPGKINWGSSGTGGSPHFGLLILQAATGIDISPREVAIDRAGIRAQVDTPSGVIGLNSPLIGEHTPCLKAAAEQGGMIRVKPVLPAVTCTARLHPATATPSRHRSRRTTCCARTQRACRHIARSAGTGSGSS